MGKNTHHPCCHAKKSNLLCAVVLFQDGAEQQTKHLQNLIKNIMKPMLLHSSSFLIVPDTFLCAHLPILGHLLRDVAPGLGSGFRPEGVHPKI